jgi:mono/diheme cytochrome c family protein
MMAARTLPACLLLLAASDWSLQRMLDQARCDTDEATQLFPDGRCDQTPPDGVVAYAPQAGAPATAQEHASLRTRIAHGRTRFELFCAPCHGQLGDGRSRVAQNMVFRKPPELTGARVAAMSVDYVMRVIEQGFGLMPRYDAVLDEHDRRAVVAYVRVLAISQNAELAELPESMREEARRWLR